MNHHRITNSFFIIILFLTGLNGFAQEINRSNRPVSGVYGIEIGASNVKADYLSPLRYSGSMLAAWGQWSKAMPFNPESAIMWFEGKGEFANMLNPAHTARMMGLNAEFSWSLEWRKRLRNSFQISVGGGPQISGGAYYLIRNSNNPVQAMANFSLMISGYVSKHFKIGNLPVLISDRIKLPSLGVFFAPQYGETYFEIYLGNHKGLAHAGWWGNNFRLDNILAVTLDFGRTAMEVGYRLNVYNQWANNLNSCIASNAFVIGVIPGGIGLKKKNSAFSSIPDYSLY